MKNTFVATIFVGTMLAFANQGMPAEGEAPKTESKAQAKADLQVLIGKVQGKVNEGKKTAQDFADELKQFDVLLAKYKDQKTDDVAQILVMKAMLYLQILEDPAKGAEFMTQLKKDFPDTPQGKKADDYLTMIKKQEEATKIQRGLAVGSKFPDFDEKDLAGKPLKVANHKGKVVLVDFWATWCGPCVRELPNVLKTYEKFHDKGFEIIGISLDQDKTKLTNFLEQQKMPWQQYFDGLGWGNKLAGKYGINGIPATFLLNGEGTIIGKNLRGEELEAEVAKVLEKK
jgi:peroxiredoxin